MERKKANCEVFSCFWEQVLHLDCRDYRRKMVPKNDVGIFLGYSTNSRAYRVYNSRTQVVMESINVIIDDATKNKGPEVVPGVEAYAKTSAQEKITHVTIEESKSDIGQC
jgi:hypothetical protein